MGRKLQAAGRAVARAANQQARESGWPCCVLVVTFVLKAGLVAGSLAPVLRDVFLT